MVSTDDVTVGFVTVALAVIEYIMVVAFWPLGAGLPIIICIALSTIFLAAWCCDEENSDPEFLFLLMVPGIPPVVSVIVAIKGAELFVKKFYESASKHLTTTTEPKALYR